jgi:hypothetical protein
MLTFTIAAVFPTDVILNCKESPKSMLDEVADFVIVIFDKFFVEVVTAK